jgi:hypothetical protein
VLYSAEIYQVQVVVCGFLTDYEVDILEEEECV